MEKAFNFFAKRGATAFMLPEWVPTWENLEFGAAIQQLDRVILGMINNRRSAAGQAASLRPKAAAEMPSNGVAAEGSDADPVSSSGSDRAPLESSSSGSHDDKHDKNDNSSGGSSGSSSQRDLLQSLLLARDEDGLGMSDTALRDELMTLLVAGAAGGHCAALVQLSCAPALLQSVFYAQNIF